MGRRTPQKKIRLVWLWIWMIQFAAMLALSLIAALTREKLSASDLDELSEFIAKAREQAEK